MQSHSFRNPVFDPKNADWSGKMKQNATFCNKPPPLAPPGPKNSRIYLISQGLRDTKIVRIQKTESHPRFSLPTSVTPCLRGFSFSQPITIEAKLKIRTKP
jgi:hypothetical protein